MSKLNEAATSSTTINVGGKIEEEEEEESVGKEEEEEEEATEAPPPPPPPATAVDDTVNNADAVGEKNSKTEDDNKEILKFTMLFNKYNCDLDMKRSWRSEEGKRDNKWTMFFNKEVTIRPNAETKDSTSSGKAQGMKKTEKAFRQTLSRTSKTKFHLCNQSAVPEPQISEPGMMYTSSLVSSLPDVFKTDSQSKMDTIRKFFHKRNPKLESYPSIKVNIYPGPQKDLIIHNSLTNLPKTSKVGLTEVKNLKSKIPSLTALDSTTNTTQPKEVGFTRFSYWDDFMLIHNDVDKRLNLQISRSSNDNNRRSALKFKKEDPGSVSDSKLLDADSESKKPIKKCDKKSRGDSSRKEKESGNRKQVQWKTEVDVIYFSTNLAANGDRTREIIGRVMEPLREEWEQQRKGFYAKVVPSQMENHVKDRFISLLKI